MQGSRSTMRWLEASSIDSVPKDEEDDDLFTDPARVAITQAAHSLFTANHVYAQSDRFGDTSFQGMPELIDVYREASYE